MIYNINSWHPPVIWIWYYIVLISSKFTNQQHILVHICILPMHTYLSPMTRNKKKIKINPLLN